MTKYLIFIQVIRVFSIFVNGIPWHTGKYIRGSAMTKWLKSTDLGANKSQLSSYQKKNCWSVYRSCSITSGVARLSFAGSDHKSTTFSPLKFALQEFEMKEDDVSCL